MLGWPLVAVGPPVVYHCHGLLLILFGKDDICAASGFGIGLFKPPLGAGASYLVVVVGCWCSGLVCVSCLCCPSEPGWVSLVYWTCMPWYTTSAIPEPDKSLSVASFAPSSVVQLAHVEFVLCTVHCMVAGWAV